MTMASTQLSRSPMPAIWMLVVALLLGQYVLPTHSHDDATVPDHACIFCLHAQQAHDGIPSLGFMAAGSTTEFVNDTLVVQHLADYLTLAYTARAPPTH